MKLLEKLKNTFFEEEYVEIEEPERKEVVARKVEPVEVPKKEIRRTKVVELDKDEEIEEKEEEENLIIEEKKVENYSDNEILKKDSKLPYFDEDDFLDSKSEIRKNKTRDKSIIEVPKKLYGESPDKLYSSINYQKEVSSEPYGATIKGSFQPTPIISPIYGVLDKNYRKEEVIDKKDRPSSYVSRKNADLDSVRKKAYGDYSSIQEVTPKPIVEEENTDTDDSLLFDMTQENSKPVVDQVTIADAEEYFNDLGLEYNIDYKDQRYEKATGRRTSIPVKEEVEEEKEEDANLEDNLFDLIDSMYEEGENDD